MRGTLGRQFWRMLDQYGILPRPGNGRLPDERCCRERIRVSRTSRNAPSPRANAAHARGTSPRAARFLRAQGRAVPAGILCFGLQVDDRALMAKRYPHQLRRSARPDRRHALFAAPLSVSADREACRDSHMRSSGHADRGGAQLTANPALLVLEDGTVFRGTLVRRAAAVARRGRVRDGDDRVPGDADGPVVRGAGARADVPARRATTGSTPRTSSRSRSRCAGSSCTRSASSRRTGAPR